MLQLCRGRVSVEGTLRCLSHEGDSGKLAGRYCRWCCCDKGANLIICLGIAHICGEAPAEVQQSDAESSGH